MRRKDREVTSTEWMEELLRRGEWLVLSMADTDGMPYSVPINYGYSDGALILHGATEGKKIDILRRNPRVCFQLTLDAEVIRHETNPAAFGMKFKSVSGSGIAEFIEDPAEKRKALAKLVAHFDGPEGFIPDKLLAATAVIRVKIEEMTGKSNGYPKP